MTTGKINSQSIQTDTIIYPDEVYQLDYIAQPSTTLTDIVSDIIYDNMIPDREANGHITEEESYNAANEILYCMSIYGMEEDDLPYILSLFYSEAKFDPRAQNRYGCGSCASGFGQLMGIHAHKLGCINDHNWNGCDLWADIELNIYVSFDIMAYPEYAYNSIDQRWRNIYRYNYNTGPGTGYIGVQYHSMFKEQLDNKLVEVQYD